MRDRSVIFMWDSEFFGNSDNPYSDKRDPPVVRSPLVILLW